MLSPKMMRRIVGLAAAWILLAAPTARGEEGRVDGWIKAGQDEEGYAIGTEEVDGGVVAYLRSLDPAPRSYAALLQFFDAAEYEGRRLRMTARVRPEGVEDFCALFLRVDRDRRTVAFDNMADRPLSGSGDWRTCTLVVDVPDPADTIFLGVILRGEGKAQLDDVELEIVGREVPLTGNYYKKDKPANLDFEE